MRTTSSFLFLGLVSLLLLPKSALAQNTVDTETLRKADEIMAKVKAANSNDLMDLVSQFGPLVSADGLSGPCQKLVISMQTMASTTIPSDVLASMPEAMKNSTKAQNAGSETKLAAERKACVDAGSTQAQTNKKVSSPQEDAKGGSAKSASEQIAAPASGGASIKPIDPEIIANNFKAGTFKTETLEIGADGNSKQETAAMCMNVGSANILVFGVLAGVAGCEPQSSSEDKSSIAVTANCPATSKMGANFYSGTLHWSADGKQIEMEGKRVALEQGKPTDKVLQLMRSKLSHVSQNCE